tara:strand:- start:716 stop:1330 length:615 start_codon:yes stop_codon:yes gene_type:complete
MQSFKSFITEAKEGIGLTVFDIDDTLFRTFASIKVVKDDKTVKSLSNQEYNVYKLKDGETFDFGEFRNAENFRKTSIPITKMINKAKAIIRNAEAAGSKVIIMTARADFDDKKIFLQTFKDHGLNLDNVYIERAGNLGDKNSSAKNKRFLFHKYLRSGKYARVRFFDDALSNINMFKSLQKQYPLIKFEAYLVQSDGSIKKVIK